MAQTNKSNVSASQKEIVSNIVSKPIETVENNESINTTEDSSNSYKQIIKSLIASGCKRINSIRIKNVNCTEKDNYTMVSFTLSSPIPGYPVNQETGAYEFGLTNILYTSLYSIVGAMKENEDLGWMANTLVENPAALNLILNGATVDIIQQEVSAGEEIVNPFSQRGSEPTVYDHDVIINHVIDFKLSKVGQKMSDRLADKLFGF